MAPRLATLVTASLVVAAALAACSDSIPDPPSAAECHALADEVCPAVTVPFLYKVDVGGKTSYLFGTRHVGITMAKLPAYVVEHFRASTTIVFESIDDTPLFGSASGPPLSEQLGPELWDRYRALVGSEPAQRFDHRSVVAATARIFLVYEDESEQIDAELEHAARAATKQLVGLEDAAQSTAIGGDILGLDALRDLLGKVRRRDQLAARTREDLSRYCAGDYDADTGAGDPGMARQNDSVAARNHAWLPKLEPLFARGGAFVVVGARHLVGPSGLVEALRAAGDHVVHVSQ